MKCLKGYFGILKCDGYAVLQMMLSMINVKKLDSTSTVYILIFVEVVQYTIVMPKKIIF
jgi:hypothetical protein